MHVLQRRQHEERPGRRRRAPLEHPLNVIDERPRRREVRPVHAQLPARVVRRAEVEHRARREGLRGPCRDLPHSDVGRVAREVRRERGHEREGDPIVGCREDRLELDEPRVCADCALLHDVSRDTRDTRRHDLLRHFSCLEVFVPLLLGRWRVLSSCIGRKFTRHCGSFIFYIVEGGVEGQERSADRKRWWITVRPTLDVCAHVVVD